MFKPKPKTKQKSSVAIMNSRRSPIEQSKLFEERVPYVPRTVPPKPKRRSKNSTLELSHDAESSKMIGKSPLFTELPRFMQVPKPIQLSSSSILPYGVGMPTNSDEEYDYDYNYDRNSIIANKKMTNTSLQSYHTSTTSIHSRDYIKDDKQKSLERIRGFLNYYTAFAGNFFSVVNKILLLKNRIIYEKLLRFS
jgi:hypothetical protein